MVGNDTDPPAAPNWLTNTVEIAIKKYREHQAWVNRQETQRWNDERNRLAKTGLPEKEIDHHIEISKMVEDSVRGSVLGMAGKGFTSVKNIGKIGEALGVDGRATNVVDALKLNKSLASEQQIGEIMNGGVETIAGAGSKAPIRDVQRLVNEYGGKARDWTKIRSSHHKAPDGTSFETHGYRNIRTGKVVEIKTKFQ